MIQVVTQYNIENEKARFVFQPYSTLAKVILKYLVKESREDIKNIFLILWDIIFLGSSILNSLIYKYITTTKCLASMSLLYDTSSPPCIRMTLQSVICGHSQYLSKQAKKICQMFIILYLYWANSKSNYTYIQISVLKRCKN